MTPQVLVVNIRHIGPARQNIVAMSLLDLHQITDDLLGYELIVRDVCIQCIDNPLSIAPGVGANSIMFKAIGFRKAYNDPANAEPTALHTLGSQADHQQSRCDQLWLHPGVLSTPPALLAVAGQTGSKWTRRSRTFADAGGLPGQSVCFQLCKNKLSIGLRITNGSALLERLAILAFGRPNVGDRFRERQFEGLFRHAALWHRLS